MLDAFNLQLDNVSTHLQRLQGASGDPLPGRVLNNLEDVRQHVEQKTLRRMLATTEDLDEEQLYAEIERAEEVLRNQITSRKEAEDTLRTEVERLAVDVAVLQKSANKYWQEAESVQEIQDKASIRRHEEVNAMKRHVLVYKRNADFTRKLYTETQRYSDQMSKMQEEQKVYQRKSDDLRDIWEIAVQEVNKVAKRVEDLEREKARLEWELGERDREAEQHHHNVSSINTEVKAMVQEQQALQKELRRAEDAQELQQLVENERAAVSKKRLTTSVLIEQIAELEESGDVIERRSQAIIEEMRIVLERGAMQVMELEHSKRQADEWVKAMWSTVCQQKREQLLLHQRMKEEDLWTAHLQERTDALVEELRQLEEQVREYEGPVGATEREKQMEEDMFRQLQKIREKRRGAQHQLAINLARRKPLLDKLDDAEQDHWALEAKLQPLRQIMGTDAAGSGARPRAY